MSAPATSPGALKQAAAGGCMHRRLQATIMCMEWELCGSDGACLKMACPQQQAPVLSFSSSNFCSEEFAVSDPALCAPRAADSHARASGPPSGPAKAAAPVHMYQTHVSAAFKSMYSAAALASVSMLSVGVCIVYCSSPAFHQLHITALSGLLTECSSALQRCQHGWQFLSAMGSQAFWGPSCWTTAAGSSP